MKYSIMVKPGSKIEKIVFDGENLTLFIHARAHDGEANDAVIKILAKYFHVAKSQIKIVSGLKNKKKIIEII